MRYQRRPVVVEAVQFDPAGAHKTALPEGVKGVPSCGLPLEYEGRRFFLETPGRIPATQLVIPGDYIVTDARGNRFVLFREVFENVYEPIEQEEG